MLNSLQVLQHRRGALPADVGEALDLLDQDVARFRRMVLDLLEISRTDSSDTGSKERVSIAELVRHAADATAARPVTEVSPAADVVVKADKRRLEQVVVNLVENAENHGRGCRRVSVCRRGDAIRLVVDDCGPGVPVESRDRVFERFARGSATQGDTGVGLGLAIVDRHVRWHDGRVWIDDRPGGGARFVVELPIGTP